jgi:magnesium-transporting ATPase (P-type)
MQLPWTGPGDNGSLLPTSGVPTINGPAPEHQQANRPPARPHHVRTTSAHARSIADEFSYMTVSEAAARLRTSLAQGLHPNEAMKRIGEYGPNEIPHDEPEPIWLRFLKQFQEPLIVLLLVSAGTSLLLGNMDDAVSIAVAVTIVVSVGFVQEYRSEKSIEALNHLVPNFAHLVRGKPTSSARAPTWPPSGQDPQDYVPTPGNRTPVQDVLDSASTKTMASQLVPGDLVLFTTGDRIPADIRVTRATDLTVDASNLTGETEPVRIGSEARTRRVKSYGLVPQPSNNSSLSPEAREPPEEETDTG